MTASLFSRVFSASRLVALLGSSRLRNAILIGLALLVGLVGLLIDGILKAIGPHSLLPVVALIMLTSLAAMLASLFLWRRAGAPLAQSRRELEAKVRQRTEWLRSIIDTAMVGIIVMDTRGIIQEFSPAASDIFGYTAVEAVGRGVAMLMPEPDASHHDGYLEAYLRTGQRRVIGTGREVIGRHKDGHTFPVELSVGEGWIDGERFFTGMVRDISKRRRSELEAQETQERLELALKGGNLGFWDVDLTNGKTMVNEQYRVILGYGPGEDPPVDRDIWLDCIHPDDLVAVKRAGEEYKIGQRKDYEIQYRIQSCTGEWKWLSSRGAIMSRNPDGKPTRMVGTVMDISAGKKAQLEQMALLRELNFQKYALDQHAIVSATDVAGVITYVNDRFCQVSGFRREDLVGQTHRLVKSGRHQPSFYAGMWKRIAQGKVWRGEVCNRTRQGSLYWVSATVVPFLDEAGRPERYVSIRTDITKRKQAEERLQRTRDEQFLLMELLGLGMTNASLETLLLRSLERILSTTRLTLAPKGAIFLLDETRNVLVLAARHRMPDHQRELCGTVALGQCLCGKAAQTGEMMFAAHVDDRHDIHLDRMADHGHYCMPIKSGQRLIGVLTVTLPPGHGEFAAERELLEAVCDILAAMITRKRAESAVKEAWQVVSASIDYAANIQQAILSSSNLLDARLLDHFIWWQPRDVVGGDIYWYRNWGPGILIILADCTGHGVPGAFMTLITNGALDQALLETPPGDPAILLQRMHQLIQMVLGQEEAASHRPANDGLEAGICFLRPDQGSLIFAGARFSLFHARGGQVAEIRGDKAGLGYRGIPQGVTFTNHSLTFAPESRFYLTSDGLLDQVGGPRRLGFGKNRFKKLLADLEGVPFAEQKDLIQKALLAYQGQEARRDDVAVLGFRGGVAGGGGKPDPEGASGIGPALSVGVAEIDADHQRLLGLMARLEEAIAQGAGEAVVRDILAHLLDYTSWHFRHEQRLMRQYVYPDFASHRQEHENLIRNALALRDKLTAGQMLASELHGFLGIWITEHILGADRRLGAWLGSRLRPD
ncbi:MAG: bacteriohemerythrin [Magnetococcales bacterium]|nr:bacteriohemerythrin [Magnetococcales bacterium]